jgi:hypothetical protein
MIPGGWVVKEAAAVRQPVAVELPLAAGLSSV